MVRVWLRPSIGPEFPVDLPALPVVGTPVRLPGGTTEYVREVVFDLTGVPVVQVALTPHRFRG